MVLSGDVLVALNNGLIKFPGVILFASHDHQFVETTANRIMEFLPNGTMIDKITTYDEYLASDEMARKRFVYTANIEEDENLLRHRRFTKIMHSRKASAETFKTFEPLSSTAFFQKSIKKTERRTRAFALFHM